MEVCALGSGVDPAGYCYPCDVGTASLGGYGAKCDECVPGTYANDLGASTCKKCADIGHIALGYGNDHCTRCAAGYTSTDGLTCVQAPVAPIYCYGGYAQSSTWPNPCEFCPIGTFSQGGIGVPCSPCGPGTASYDEGSFSCTQCGQYGQIALGYGNSYCTPCAAGYTSTDGLTCVKVEIPTALPTKSPVMEVCALGSGVDPAGYCYPCDVGTASLGGYGAKCDECVPGTYANDLGASTCKKCADIGHIALGYGNDHCTRCAAGYTSTDGLTCVQAPVAPIYCYGGYAQSSTWPNPCEFCPIGTFSQGGIGVPCSPCGPGTASYDEGSFSCTQCGQYGQIALGYGNSYCSPCAAGYTSTDGLTCVVAFSPNSQPTSIVLRPSLSQSDSYYTTPPTAPVTPPTTAPTTAPSNKPTTAPTTAPVTPPTTAPTTAPSNKPTTAPTTAPVTPRTTAPTTAPSNKPTTAPSKKPTTAPSKKPTKAPSKKLTKAPSKKLTTAPSKKNTLLLSNHD